MTRPGLDSPRTSHCKDLCCRVTPSRFVQRAFKIHTAVAATHPECRSSPRQGHEGPFGLGCCPYLRELAPGDLRRAVAPHHDRSTRRGRLFGDGFLQRILI